MKNKYLFKVIILFVIFPGLVLFGIQLERNAISILGSQKNIETAKDHYIKKVEIDDQTIRRFNDAVCSCDIKTVEQMMKQQPLLVNQENFRGYCPLHLAVLSHDNQNMIKLLIERGADPNRPVNTTELPVWTPVFLAVNDPDYIFYLAGQGADCEYSDDIGRTILHLCAFRGRADLIRAYTELGLDVNKTDNQKQTPLHYALKGFNCTSGSKYVETIQVLVLKGALLEVTDIYGNKPVYYCLSEYDINHKKVDNSAALETMIRLGADVENPVHGKWQTLQAIVKLKKLKKHYEILCKYHLDKTVSK